MDRQYRSIIDGTINRWTRWFKSTQWHTLWYDTKSLQNGVEYSTSTTGLAYDKNIDRNKESWPGLCRDIGPHCSHMTHGEQRRAKAGQTPLTQCPFSIPLDRTPVKWILQVWGASPIIRSNFIWFSLKIIPYFLWKTLFCSIIYKYIPSRVPFYINPKKHSINKLPVHPHSIGQKFMKWWWKGWPPTIKGHHFPTPSLSCQHQAVPTVDVFVCCKRPTFNLPYHAVAGPRGCLGIH